MMRLHEAKGIRARRASKPALAAAAGAALLLALASLGGARADGADAGATDKVRLRAQLGIIYAQNGQVDDARKEFIKLLEEPNGRAAALTNLGNLAVMDGNLPVAIENYTQAAALDTVDGGILLDLGLAQKQAGDDAGSQRSFARALTKAGGADQAAWLLGIRSEDDTSKGKVSKLSSEEIKAMLAKARTRVPGAADSSDAAARARTQVVSRPGGARAADVSVGATSLYWKEK